MKRLFYLSIAALLFTGCSSDEIIDNGGKDNRQVPITMSANKSNITRASNLESILHYNFGVWAQKVKTGSNQTVMENYLVGYGGTNVGYNPTNSNTHAAVPGTTADHKSPWFYEGLGKSEYSHTADDGFYKSSQTAYMSANDNQYLRYWDLAYTNTYFYCYAPYKKEGVTINMNNDGSATMTFEGTAIRDGYDNPLNSDYASFDRSLSEFMYAGVKATNSNLSDITVPFHHMGAQLFIRFYEDVPGYKVEILDLDEDNGNVGTYSGDIIKGIQATPALTPTTGTTYNVGSYYTASGATVSFDTEANGNPDFDYSNSSTAQVQTNLMFKVPSNSETYANSNVPTGFAYNLTAYNGLSSTIHQTIKEKVSTGTQEYSWSPTIYYPVAQPSTQETGFTFHVTYRIIAEDNQEVITVHNATVFVPAATSDATPVSIARWETNKRYIYTFKITRNATGTTNPNTEIDPTNPTPDREKSLYPIVFDGCTVEDYTEQDSDHEIN